VVFAFTEAKEESLDRRSGRSRRRFAARTAVESGRETKKAKPGSPFFRLQGTLAFLRESGALHSKFALLAIRRAIRKDILPVRESETRFLPWGLELFVSAQRQNPPGCPAEDLSAFLAEIQI
jgi:hypothetical protein